MSMEREALLQSLVELWYSWHPLDKKHQDRVIRYLKGEAKETACKFQTTLVEQIIASSFAIEHRIHPESEQRFLKSLILALEHVGLEVDERLYEAKVSSQRPQRPQKTYFRHGQVLCSLAESRQLIEHGTTGLRTWEAALALVDYLLSLPIAARPSSIVELGAGLGYVGLSLLRADFCDRALLTDSHPEVLDALKWNCKANFAADRGCVRVQSWDWTAVDMPECLKQYDLCVAADVVFDPELIAPLVRCVRECLLFMSEAIVACTLRNENTLNQFRSELAAASLHVQEKHLEQAVPAVTVIVFHISKRSQI